jgi:hypothetical protein
MKNEIMNLKDLKINMWIEVCEGDDEIEMSKEYKELVSGIGDEEVSGGMYILNFYKLLDILIDNNLIEFEGGEMDWCCNYLNEYGEGDKFNEYYNDYLKLIKM